MFFDLLFGSISQINKINIMTVTSVIQLGLIVLLIYLVIKDRRDKKWMYIKIQR